MSVVSFGMKEAKPVLVGREGRVDVVSSSICARACGETRSVIMSPPSLSRTSRISAVGAVEGSEAMVVNGVNEGSRGDGGPTSVSGRGWDADWAMIDLLLSGEEQVELL